MLRIGVDAMGGDFAPVQVILGAADAMQQLSGLATLVLLGDADKITGICRENGIDPGIFVICPCSQVLEMHEQPVIAYKHKPDSSMARGFQMLAEGQLDAFASAGNTGAMLVGSVTTVGSLTGVIRPCISAEIPLLNGGKMLLLDVGFNTDAKPDVLYQFAELGTVYAQTIMGIDQPSVALLNIGEESEKGNMTTREAYKMLEESPTVNFVGNMEANHLYDGGKADVLVCDGFVGNICLKQSEALYSVCARLGLNREFLNRFNYEEYGGTPVLGIKAPVVIGHGASSPRAISRMILKAYDVASSGLVQRIQQQMLD